MDERALDVLETWWGLGESKWYNQSDKTDDMLRKRFSALVEDARSGKLDHWEQTPHETLALLILLDQLPRNIFRGTPDAFASDEKAVRVADSAREKRFDKAFYGVARAFFYMPYMHSEDLQTQMTGCTLFRQTGHKEGYHYALMHMDAIQRFGRFPHRNKILGRASTPEENDYMQTGGFSA